MCSIDLRDTCCSFVDRSPLQSLPGEATFPYLVRSHFRHFRNVSDGQGDLYKHIKGVHAVSIRLPRKKEPRFTTLPLDVFTDNGKRACQQVMLDAEHFWLGEPVEYLALYVRDW